MISIRGEDLLVAWETEVIGQSISNRYQGSPAVSTGGSTGGVSVTALPFLSVCRPGVGGWLALPSPEQVTRPRSYRAIPSGCGSDRCGSDRCGGDAYARACVRACASRADVRGRRKGHFRKCPRLACLCSPHCSPDTFPSSSSVGDKPVRRQPGTSCHDPPGGGGQVRYSRNMRDLSAPHQCMLASPVSPITRS